MFSPFQLIHKPLFNFRLLSVASLILAYNKELCEPFIYHCYCSYTWMKGRKWCNDTNISYLKLRNNLINFSCWYIFIARVKYFNVYIHSCANRPACLREIFFYKILCIWPIVILSQNFGGISEELKKLLAQPYCTVSFYSELNQRLFLGNFSTVILWSKPKNLVQKMSLVIPENYRPSRSHTATLIRKHHRVDQNSPNF